jgi:hypothetical protein
MGLDLLWLLYTLAAVRTSSGKARSFSWQVVVMVLTAEVLGLWVGLFSCGIRSSDWIWGQSGMSRRRCSHSAVSVPGAQLAMTRHLPVCTEGCGLVIDPP